MKTTKTFIVVAIIMGLSISSKGQISWNSIPIPVTSYTVTPGSNLSFEIQRIYVKNTYLAPQYWFVPNVVNNELSSTTPWFVLSNSKFVKQVPTFALLGTTWSSFSMVYSLGWLGDTVKTVSPNVYSINLQITIPVGTPPGTYTVKSTLSSMSGSEYPGSLLILNDSLFSSVKITVKGGPKKFPTSLLENSEQEDDIVMFPNPTTDIIQFANLETEMKFEIFDILGKRWKNGVVSNIQNQINVNNLPLGNYLINLISEKYSKTLKLVKQ